MLFRDLVHTVHVVDRVVGVHELGHDVDGDGEDDGAVVLSRDAVECLQIS